VAPEPRTETIRGCYYHGLSILFNANITNRTQDETVELERMLLIAKKRLRETPPTSLLDSEQSDVTFPDKPFAAA